MADKAIADTTSTLFKSSKTSTQPVILHAPVTEVLILMIAFITASVYVSQSGQPVLTDGIPARFHSAGMILVALLSMGIGSVLAMTLTNRWIMIVYTFVAIAIPLIYPIFVSSICLANENAEKTAHVYYSVNMILLVMMICTFVGSLVVITMVGIGLLGNHNASYIVSCLVPLVVGSMLFSSAVLASR